MGKRKLVISEPMESSDKHCYIIVSLKIAFVSKFSFGKQQEQTCDGEYLTRLDYRSCLEGGGGHWSDIISHEDKIGGRKRTLTSFSPFKEFIAKIWMAEFAWIGHTFTWGYVKEKLDRNFGSRNCLAKYPNAFKFLNHGMLLLNLTPEISGTNKRWFKFDSRWVGKAEFQEVVKKILKWSMGLGVLFSLGYLLVNSFNRSFLLWNKNQCKISTLFPLTSISYLSFHASINKRIKNTPTSSQVNIYQILLGIKPHQSTR
ncbi:pyridoxal biosynthesis lyase PdxS [Striga asiatica]|uniref:Pyridoxal biosynthesis lyase PdxS n=1 Tax=Striga asiatica TaxID=4170 RepID=A0A5A7P6Y1_STRAF|nr:pyridoxal biosynthesis lyase PdxS [Striga asiatica]